MAIKFVFLNNNSKHSAKFKISTVQDFENQCLLSIEVYFSFVSLPVHCLLHLFFL